MPEALLEVALPEVVALLEVVVAQVPFPVEVMLEALMALTQ